MTLEEPGSKTDAYGDQEWTVNGVRHRTDGPALIMSNGVMIWNVNGLTHRTDGPAVMRPSGRHDWYIQDRHMTREVLAWMEKKDITWPWSDQVQIEFELTWS